MMCDIHVVLTSMLPLLIKDHLVIAFVALVIIFYLVADLCLSEADGMTAVDVNSSGDGSHTHTVQLHSNKTLSLVVCKSVFFCIAL